jgi:predicted TIM-barrel fold metal-dependent hydrolase
MFFDSLTHLTKDGRWFGTHHDASLARLLRENRRAGVTKALLCALPGKIDNDFVLSCAKRHSALFIPVAGLNPKEFSRSSQLDTEMRSLKKRGFRGIKLHPRLGAYHPLDRKVEWAVKSAGACGLPVLFCTVWSHPMPPLKSPVWDIIDRICRMDEGACIIFMHGGYFDFLAVSEIIKNHENALLDLSYTFLRFKDIHREAFDHVFRNFDRKTVLGSDFPEMTFGEVRVFLKTFRLPEEKKDNITFNNLKKVFL